MAMTLERPVRPSYPGKAVQGILPLQLLDMPLSDVSDFVIHCTVFQPLHKRQVGHEIQEIILGLAKRARHKCAAGVPIPGKIHLSVMQLRAYCAYRLIRIQTAHFGRSRSRDLLGGIVGTAGRCTGNGLCQ